jgi:serine/alanine adding enzyme
MTLTITNSIDEKTWREFVNQHPQGNVFHTPEMFEVFSRTNEHAPEIWFAVNDKHLLAVFMPVQITLLTGIFRHLSTRSIAYGSILCLPDSEPQDALMPLLKNYKRETGKHSLFTELRNLSCLGELQPILAQERFVYQEHLNYLIDLDRPPEAIFQSIGHRTRKNIRHGINQGKVIIEEVKKREDIAACYELICKTYQTAKVPLADLSLFEAAFDLLYPKGMVRFSLARVGEDPVAVSVELLYKDVIYGWYSGLDRSFSSYSPNELLMWDILKWGAENGYRIYDFGGAGKPNEKSGVRDFKAKFGGRLVSYGRNTWVPNPVIFGISRLGYDIYRRFLKFSY